MQKSSLSSSSASSSLSSTCSLQSMVSCKSFPKSMAACTAQRPLPQIKREKLLRFIASDDGMAMPSRCSLQKSSATSSHRELDCPLKQCDEYTEVQAGHGDGNLDCMCEGNLNPKTHLKPRCMVPSANANCVEHSGREELEEGGGECDGDHVSSSADGSPSLWDDSEDSNKMSWRRLSPAAASCFCKDIEEEQEYFQQVLGSSSHGWTDEKHSSYLDSMEAEFLKSVMFKGRDIHHSEPTTDLDDSASSHQTKAAEKEFKVCQSGKWRPVLVQASFVNVGPLKQLAVAVKNPWIKRFRASNRPSYVPSLIMEDPLFEEANMCCSSQWHE